MKIGLEIHVGLPTKTKLFCSCKAYVEDEPNTSICPICMGFPGSKPMLNREALSIALSIAKALNCDIKNRLSFVRKVYFYPDLPKSYQITQTEEPVGSAGYISCNAKRIRIRRVQIEEDPAKIIRKDDYTLLDFNRSGQPLVEVVTEPDITGEGELRLFMNELEGILYYLGIDIEEIKADLNISLAEQRVEVKNITGVKNLVDAARYEISRQSRLISSRQEIRAETRSYDQASMSTVASREKESEEEYGFLYDPDLTFYSTANIKTREITYPSRIAAEYAKRYGANANTLGGLISFSSDALRLINSAKERHEMKTIINSIELLKRYDKLGIKEDAFEKLLSLLKREAHVDKATIEKLERNERIDINKEVSEEDIDREILSLIKENSGLLKEYKKNSRVFNFIVGKVMKKRRANPKYIAERLRYLLGRMGD